MKRRYIFAVCLVLATTTAALQPVAVRGGAAVRPPAGAISSTGMPVLRRPMRKETPAAAQPEAAAASSDQATNAAVEVEPSREPAVVPDRLEQPLAAEDAVVTPVPVLPDASAVAVVVEPTPQPPSPAEAALSADEAARMQAAVADAQARMSNARAGFRIQAIAGAEDELRQANERLEQARSAQPDAAELAAAQRDVDTAQADAQRIREAQAGAGGVELQAAQAKLNQLRSPDPTAIASAQERLAAAQRQWEQVAGAASATKTAAEDTMRATDALVARARQDHATAVQRYQTATEGSDPLTGQPFADEQTALEQQRQYAAVVAAREQELLAAEAQLVRDHAAFEAAKQHEIDDTAAARAAVDQTQAELDRTARPPTADELAQAQAEVVAAQAALDSLKQAEQRVSEATARLEAVRGGGNTTAVTAAQQDVDAATARLAAARQAGVARSGWSWPTYGTITSGFGKRALLGGRLHNGVDVADERGTPIVAARDGTVREAGWCAGYGYCVKLAHADGFSSEYGHLDSMPLVQAGQRVAAGTVIGRMGTTYDAEHGGFSTGVHLHFTIKRHGAAVDPLLYLP